MGAKKQEKRHSSYMTRNQALKYLQLSLSDFRRLCILKGIFPRDPPHIKEKVIGKTYYLTTDIQWLANEPLMDKFRSIKAHLKKVARFDARKETEHADQLADAMPRYTLDHLIRERYPSFHDALRDMSDALNMVHLFATMYSSDNVQNKMIMTCQRLSREWQAYVASTKILTKSFVSIRGVYMQVDLDGTPITWVMPHEFSQEQTDEVDYRVMETFLEFYTTLAGFVLYRLYTRRGVAYPPAVDAEKDKNGAWLDAITLAAPTDSADDATDAEADRTRTVELLGSMDPEDPQYAPQLLQLLENEDTVQLPGLLNGMEFFLSRGVPTKPVALAIRACGGTVVSEPTERSTVVSERPDTPESILPQWVFDSINFRMRMPFDEYSNGQAAPPHLSPFEDFTSGTSITHVPERFKEVRARWATAWAERLKEARYRTSDGVALVVPEEDLEADVGDIDSEEEEARLALATKRVRNRYAHVKAAHEEKTGRVKRLLMKATGKTDEADEEEEASGLGLLAKPKGKTKAGKSEKKHKPKKVVNKTVKTSVLIKRK
ncbi:26S proteasome subunit P45 new pescadillo-like protein [Carpediemonas membranifera]|uniref:Pescadillo homolog n=1 Tax=Carpediemonas membranifera TaxID=201153 RepID=A0A8J6AT74_9EUKA|nr:26S proteasome subunit P45 new pescadillo-like protein [Carpediemonas membranifera]|eukprot:KAG9393931.1 26S proteasome subunit P45 new pescadillo-like protein [Carpediemonas membranifera]